MNSRQFEGNPPRVGGVVLAAGLGTRIGALTRLRPKPLLPVGATTPFARAVEGLRAAGASAIVANASHLSAQIVAAGARLDVRVVVEVDGPLGTAGGVAACRDRENEQEITLVWNGDIVCDLDARRLVAAMGASCEVALAVHGAAPVGGGNVGLDEQGRVVRLRDRAFPARGRESRGAWFSALAALRASVIADLPARGCLVADVYLPRLARGADVRAVHHENRWHDIGDLRSYLDANLDALDGAPSIVAKGARVSPEITLDRAIIGEGARLDGAGVVRRSVVWPGARASAPLEDAVVTDAGEVVHVG